MLHECPAAPNRNLAPVTGDGRRLLPFEGAEAVLGAQMDGQGGRLAHDDAALVAKDATGPLAAPQLEAAMPKAVLSHASLCAAPGSPPDAEALLVVVAVHGLAGCAHRQLF